MTNVEISKVLEEIGTMLELKGENPFKVRAYERAARELETQNESVEDLVADGRLEELPGIGKALVEKITELVTTGRLKYYEDLRATIPEGLFEMLHIPGFGPKKVNAVFTKMGISTLEELEAAATEGRLSSLEGFGKKTETKILEGLESMKQRVGLRRLGDVLPVAEEIVAALVRCEAVNRVCYAGSLRRMKEVVKDIDVLASSDEPETVMDLFVGLPVVSQVVAKGSTKSSVLLSLGIACDLRVVPEESFAAAMQYFTGSKDHNVHLRGLAKDLGYKVNEYGVFRGEESIPCATEEEIYELLGLQNIPPEMREDTGEIPLAADRSIPRLIEATDIVGMLHCHTRWSDGRNSVEELARAVQERGYQYLAICDHSQSSYIANGLTIERLQQQWTEIDDVNRNLRGFHILKGIESDIRSDGSLDYPEEILAQLDLVVGSVHQSLNMPAEQMTSRLVTALANPHLHILGHPTMRLLLEREPSAFDMEAVIEAAALHGKILELNANYYRLDLNWLHCKLAKSRGVKIAINTDAHDLEGLDHIRYGIGTARRGWLTKEDVVNCLGLDDLRALVRR